MARWTLAVLAALLGLALAAPAQAQWKWRDKNGQTQYSDLPPPSAVPEQDILSRPNSAKRRLAAKPPVPADPAASGATGSASAPLAAASSALVPKTTDSELEARRKKAEADQAAKTKADEAKVAAARADNCARAKAQLRTLDSGIRLARTNAKGEREFLDDKQRAEEAGHTRQVISADCK
jgi:type IV secretory pathway VirB10-like protein